MNAFATGINNFVWNLLNRPQFKDWFDILLVAYLIYKLLMLTRETRASQVLKGFAVLIIVSWFSSFLGLTALNWLLMSVVNNGALVLVVLFQPELRKALEQIGRGTRIDRSGKAGQQGDRIVRELTQTMLSLSRRRIGALVVFEGSTGLKEFIDTGTTLDAEISSALLVNIFEPNTPLHDGAVIIRDNRIAAAGCVLNLSDQSNLSRDLGTRHRAGLGVTENTDAMVLIVSEETGIISLAQGGKLDRHQDADSLTRVLSTLYGDTRPSLKQTYYDLKSRILNGGSQRHE